MHQILIFYTHSLMFFVAFLKTQKKKPKDSPLPVSPASLCSPIKDSPLSLGPSRKSHPKPKNKAREVGEIIAPEYHACDLIILMV